MNPPRFPKDAFERAFHAVKRSHQALGDAEYRRAIAARTLTRQLHKLNPNVAYLALREEGELTFLHVDDSVITPWVIAVGHFQRHEFHSAWQQCKRLAPRRANGVFLDVGANVGTTTLYAMRTGEFSRAVCLEPSPANLAVLQLNVSCNGLGDAVTVIAAACSDEVGTADLWVTSGNQGDHRLAGSTDAPETHESVLTVATTTLDAGVRAAEVRPSDVAMVWVDTQGHEPGVLAGAAEIIADGAPFCIEFWPAQYAELGHLDSLLELLRTHFAGFLDLHGQDTDVQPISEISRLTDSLVASSGQTDIILQPR